jgi:hypothetical protein
LSWAKRWLLTDGPDAVSDLFALRVDALKLVVRRVRFMGNLLEACGGPCREATWTAFFRCTVGVLQELGASLYGQLEIQEMGN